MTFRRKFLLSVLFGAVLPLMVVGGWLTRSLGSAGEDLLRSQLEGALAHVVQGAESRWMYRRADLLLLARNAAVQDALRPAAPPGGAADAAALAYLREAYADMGGFLDHVRFRDARGEVRWTLSSGLADLPALWVGPPGDRPAVEPASPGLPVHLDIRDDETGAVLGTFEARVRLDGLLPPGALGPDGTGAVLAAFDTRSSAPILAPPFEAALLRSSRFRVDGVRWISATRSLEDPPLELVMAAPVELYIRPFRERAVAGTLVLLLIGTGVLLAQVGFIGRLAASLRRLVDAAEAVAGGDLEVRVDPEDADEVGKLAVAFNRMAERLHGILGELVHRRALSAVGEFAAELAHEIRNPLSAMRVDLQLAQERAAGDERAQRPLERALREVDRLEQTVSGALRVARSGMIAAAPLDLLVPLGAAVHAARPEFVRRGAAVEGPETGSGPVPIRGDEGALEQLFLNLLLNSAQALREGGEAQVSVGANGAGPCVTIRDTGCGIPPERLHRIFEPFFTTKPDGTGLGLAVAARIAEAHGGGIEVESAVGAGTTIRVRLGGGSAGIQP